MMNAITKLNRERSRTDNALLGVLMESGLSEKELEATIGALNDAFRQFLARKGIPGQKVRCSFCHRWQSEVRRIVAGTEAAICDECIAIAQETVQRPKTTVG